MSKIPWG